MTWIGFAAPNSTWNFGADYTITPRFVSTTRYGYFFENYHDFGYPSSAVLDWGAPGNASTLECTAGAPLVQPLAQALHLGLRLLPKMLDTSTTFSTELHGQECRQTLPGRSGHCVVQDWLGRYTQLQGSAISSTGPKTKSIQHSNGPYGTSSRDRPHLTIMSLHCRSWERMARLK